MTLENKVASKFSQAAADYKKHDVLQRITANTLFDTMLDLQNKPATKGEQQEQHLVDIGCGPGTCFKALTAVTEVTAVDIAQGMLDSVEQLFPHYHRLCSDVQSLALADDSADVVYSNLAMQWCESLPKAVEQLHRVLKPGGQCHLAIVADGSLPELQALGFRVNHFSSLPSMLTAFGVEPQSHVGDNSLASQQVMASQPIIASQQVSPAWQLTCTKVEKVTVYFDDLTSLLYSIKGVGASANNDKSGSTTLSAQNERRPVMTKSQWRERNQLAQGLATDKGLPLTYHVAFIHAQKIG